MADSSALQQSKPQATPTTPMASGQGQQAAAADAGVGGQFAGMSKQQLFDLLQQMKVSRFSGVQSNAKPTYTVRLPSLLVSSQALIETNKDQARAILVANPTLTKGLLQVSNSLVRVSM